jgi:hypothetical protein
VPLFDEQVTDDLHRLFAATGRRCFIIGSLHGGFPDLGHHLPGEMGGLWTPPVKLADGFWFGVSQKAADAGNAESGEQREKEGSELGRIEWMYGPNCSRFTMQPGMVQREYLLRAGGVPIEAVQRLFVPDEEPGVLVDVTLRNASEEAVNFTLSWLVRWDIQGAWWSHWPDEPDEARFEEEWGGIAAWDSGHEEWRGAMLSDRAPQRHRTGRVMWGPEQTGSLLGVEGAKRGGILPNPDELRGAGISGQLDFDLTLQPGESTTLCFALAGGVGEPDCARQKAAELLAERDALWQKKVAEQDALVAASPGIQTPQPALDRTYALQNVCMDMLTLELPGVARGAVAGLPSFAWFFGCDTYYSVSGLLLSGQTGTTLSNLRLLANHARQQRGRVPHEITPTGRLFNPGNAVETAEFATSVERAYRWTGDRAFLEETYGVCREGIFDYLLGECDPEGTLLPDGPGLLELRSAGRGRKLDVAAALHQGLRSLEYLAHSVGDPETAERCVQVRRKVRESIDRYFWVADRGEYAWRIEHDLSVWPGEPAHSYVMMEMGVLDGSGEHETARIEALFDKVEGPEHTGPKGLIHPGTTDFVMPIQNAIVALAEFQYGRPDRGLWYLQRIAEICGRGMPWAIPEFEVMRGGYRPCFLQLWSSATYNWLMVQGWFRLSPDPNRGVVLVRPQLPAEWQAAQVKNLALWGRRYDLSLQRKDGEIEFSVVALDGDDDHPFRVDPAPDLPVAFV